MSHVGLPIPTHFTPLSPGEGRDVRHLAERHAENSAEALRDVEINDEWVVGLYREGKCKVHVAHPGDKRPSVRGGSRVGHVVVLSITGEIGLPQN